MDFLALMNHNTHLIVSDMLIFWQLTTTVSVVIQYLYMAGLLVKANTE